MTDKLKKINLILAVLVAMAGIIFLSCAFSLSVPKGVEIDGVAVGGLTRLEAAKKVRESIEEKLKKKTLEIRAGEKIYTFSFPEIYYKDNVYSLIKTAKKGDKLKAETSCYLCGANSIARNICLNESSFAVEPYAKFSSFDEPFSYFEGRDGKLADEGKLLEDIRKSLNGNFEPVTVNFQTEKRTKSMEDVKRETRLLSSFKTNFDGSNLSRSSNIRLAAGKLNGAVIQSGKTLSFNDIVGARVKERGFLPAKIIQEGQFVEGVGGGVCQVSTTLYNAALLSGLKIAEYHPHSLAVGYVPLSRDAMVSGTYFDLKITNPYDCPVYIRAQTTDSSVVFRIYGYDDGTLYSLFSEVTGILPAPEELCDSPEKAQNGKDGYTSKCYLTSVRGGVKKTLKIRSDKYSPVKKIIYPDPPESSEESAG